jgi:hypothetical protein
VGRKKQAWLRLHTVSRLGRAQAAQLRGWDILTYLSVIAKAFMAQLDTVPAIVSLVMGSILIHCKLIFISLI